MTTLGTTPTSGNDPEVLLVKDGRVVPAESALQYSEISGLTEYDNLFLPYAEHWRVTIDNAAVELHTRPGSCLQGLITETRKSLSHANHFLKNKLSRMVSFSPTEQINRADMGEYRSLRDFGCSPSMTFDNESLFVSSPRVGASETEIRSAGYHVHLGDNIGSTELAKLKNTDFQIRLVKMCNLFAGVPGVLMEKDFTEQVLSRREVVGYGRAGEFRAQRYGFEYRTLGPWPLTHAGWLFWAHSAVRDAYYAVHLNIDNEIMSHFDLRVISKTINTNDVPEAHKMWSKLNKVLNQWNDDYLFQQTHLGHVIFNPFYRDVFTKVVDYGGLKFIGLPFTLRSWGGRDGFTTIAKRLLDMLGLTRKDFHEVQNS